ncbi:acyl-CoA dehydrogenase family protein [Sphingopyxis granuli]|jgi:alkylation response protein AidB-like acyl-CoA dehydrogenase|uniref:acyl-CoA dehydrogenase family protein n=1 Tax=Sphingopyxis granuli TaxID=267128 RepID=UPI001BAEF46E|nr:acyl-CoA dehydrogenase family protein [Sphingopyxis granuli]QUM72123.1 acyl-CoA dehydrogenase family protein [Sphingopyxis granuli]
MTDADLQAEVEAWLAANWRGAPPREESFGRDPRAEWLAQVRDAGWAVPRWPRDWYGRELSAEQAKIVERAFTAAGAPGAGQDRSNLWANTALAHATDSFKRVIVPQLLAGEVGMCLLYSEPGAGSDLAAIRTRAEKVDGGWRVTGQKIWTSGAMIADYGMLIARTDWDVPKHRGISFFFLPMRQEGVEVRPLRQITDESHFNEVFITDAFVPDENLLGPLNGGWGVLQTALAYERSVMGDMARGARSGAAGAKGDHAMLELAREAGKLDDPVVRQDVAQVIAWRVLNKLNTQRAKAELAQGTSSSIMSLGKLAMSRILHEEGRLRTELLGPESLLEGPDHPRAEDANFLSLNAYFTSIGGGTDQIQRNIIGERVLGLPKEPEIDRTIPFREVRAG